MIKHLLRKGLNFNKKVIYKLENIFLNHQVDVNYSLVEKNKDLVNKYEGQTCFIIGCGPSIRNQDLSILVNHNVIGLSTFFYHEDYDKIKPLANVFTGYTYHKDVHQENHFVESYKEMDKYATGLLFFEERDNDFILKNSFFQNKDLRYYKALSSINQILKISPSLDKSIYEGQNISIFAIQIAISLGFKKIYLLGLDHSWIFQLNAKEYTKFQTTKDINFNKLQKTDFDVPGQDTFSFWVDVYHKLWSDYKLIKAFAESKDVSIVNLTDGGVLDIFERSTLESLFNKNAQ